MRELEISKFGKGSNIRRYVDESKRFGLYIVMIHMAKELYLSERPLGIDPIVKCIPNLLDCNLFFCLRVCCTAAIRKYQLPLLKLSKNQNTIKQIRQEISQILSNQREETFERAISTNNLNIIVLARTLLYACYCYGNDFTSSQNQNHKDR